MSQSFGDLQTRMPEPRIGLLPTGHLIYWGQFPGLREKGLAMLERFRQRLETIGQVFAPDLVDEPEKALQAGRFFQEKQVDLVLVFPLGYTTGMVMAPAVRDLRVPIRLLNAHVDSTYDYASADTSEYLYHEGPCCIPEYAGTLVSLGKDFRVRTGHFGQQRLWDEIEADCHGAAAARAFASMRFGLMGNTYTHMTDMPIDEHRVLRATGNLLVRPEIEEIQQAFHGVSDAQLEEMYRQFRAMYDVDPSVTNEHLRFSAQTAAAYEQVIRRHSIDAFGYYWWGQSQEVTQLRAQSALAVSRLAAMGFPGVTEGDVKTAMAMKMLDLLGGGGMFLEFFSMDFEGDFVLMGHDGPSNINVAQGRPRLQHLDVHHGKTGHGLGIDFRMRQGPITLVNLTQFDAGPTFKIIYTIAQVIDGDILHIGNPNCRVRLARPIHEFFDAWCRQGPCHHIALGLSDQGQALETMTQALGFACARI